jgi:hypothetical protein
MVAQRLREAWTTKRSVVERLQGAPEHERGVRHEAPNTAQRNVAEKNFLRFFDPVSRRKPVVCQSMANPAHVYVSPLFFTPRHTYGGQSPAAVAAYVSSAGSRERTCGEGRPHRRYIFVVSLRWLSVCARSGWVVKTGVAEPQLGASVSEFWENY